MKKGGILDELLNQAFQKTQIDKGENLSNEVETLKREI
jgi:hypothetical protein